ncbi:MAG: DEAD/DEAH box helicase family protein [Desulfosporosinus sp.]|nr:DEAD/DEAH box helicase family protein [Desulfosporosinus sp.]
MIDLRLKMKVKTPTRAAIEPIELFESLTIRSAVIKELWRTQADALREWDKNRKEQDILFMLNTGAGKTLIGLIAALSLVNETQGKVLYVCATNQLIEQTKMKAQEYGIPVSTYFNSTWDGDEFERGIGPCITNYQAVLNGKSIFNREEISAVIFDDAHTAYSIVQEQYTLKILKNNSAYEEILELLKDYYKSVDKYQRLSDVLEGLDPFSVLFVPSYISTRIANKIRLILVKYQVFENVNTLFVWEHIKDKLRYCALFIDSNGLYFVPPVPPIHSQKAFSPEVRRLYLSATVNSELTFIRTFGRYADLIIKPGGRAGDCERMILPAPTPLNDSQAREWAKEGVKNEKALIMVPTTIYSKNWTDFAEVFDSGKGHLRMRKFASSKDEKLLLVSRYDGIDMPGDDCRVLVIDGSPSGISPLEKFFEQHLNIKGITNSLIATRLTQVFGRISRGMNDHGVVILLSKKLLKWINNPRNRKLLPLHIRKQLEISDTLAAEYSDELSLTTLVRKCLDRAEDWTESYDEFMDMELDGVTIEETADKTIGEAERKFIEYLWRDEPEKALSFLLPLINTKNEEVEVNLKAWYMHWAGFCFLLLDRDEEAQRYFLRASRIKSELSRPVGNVLELLNTDKEKSVQSVRMAEVVANSGFKVLTMIENIIGNLDSAHSSNEVEEAIKQVGALLGLESSRPDKKEEIGPDCLWLTPDHKTAFVIEAKTNKKETSSYNKDEIGQYHQHIQWLSDKYSEVECSYRLIVGPSKSCSSLSSPPEDLWVVSLDSFRSLTIRLKELYKVVLEEGIDVFYISRIQDGIEKDSLTWDSLFESLEKVLMSDLQV